MATVQRKPENLKKGTIASLVYWHLSRGKTGEEVQERALSVFGRRNLRHINKEIDYWQGYKLYGAKVNTMSDNANLKNLRPSFAERGNQFIRVRATATFDNPRSEAGARRQQIGFMFDAPIEGTVGAMRDAIRQSMKEWAKHFYELSEGEAGRRIRSVNIEGLEFK